jgi:hypothetical protein
VNNDGAARLAKLNRQSRNLGGTPFLIFVQDDADVFADGVEEPLMGKLAEAIESAQAVNLVISTRYLMAIRHRAPEHWLKGQWPANLRLEPA